jgi:3'-phosphoadenosine 5'-phosphosulfate sulfotransferase (PAPS reductase)/FAD synthetase
MNPFIIDSPTCISFSRGRTSAYMLHRVLEANGGLPSESIVCFENTGKEREETLEFVRDCSVNWRVPITWLEYTGDALFAVTDFDSASRNGDPFEAVIAQRGGTLPNRVQRYCSSELKTRTMHRYLRSIGWTEWDSMLGIRADEPRRVAKFRANPSPETKAEEVYMPLADIGICAQHVGEFWRGHPFDLALPNNGGKTMHGNCDLCFLKPMVQVLSLISEDQDSATWWADKENKAKQVTTGSACRFRNDRPSYAQMLAFSEQQRDMFDPNEEAISCFCGD